MRAFRTIMGFRQDQYSVQVSLVCAGEGVSTPELGYGGYEVVPRMGCPRSQASHDASREWVQVVPPSGAERNVRQWCRTGIPTVNGEKGR